MKTAVIQLSAGCRKQENIANAVSLVERAARQGAEFILLPEAFFFRGQREKHLFSVVENIPGESTEPFMALAKKYKIFILAGSVYEKAKTGLKGYNSSALIDNQGRIAVVYRKIHLFDLDLPQRKIKESDYFLAGQKPVTALVQNFSVGLSICYDLRFPELYRGYGKQGVEILCVPSAFTYETGKAHWHVLLRARAIENLCYVLASNQFAGETEAVSCYGRSMIIDPWGKILAEASEDKEEIIFADLNKAVLLEKRKILSSLKMKEG